MQIRPSSIMWALNIAGKREREDAVRFAIHERRTQIKLQADKIFFEGLLPREVAKVEPNQAMA